MVLLIVKDVYILRGIFLLGKMNKFLAVGQDFVNLLGFFLIGENEQTFGCWVGVSLIPKVFHKDSGVGAGRGGGQSRTGRSNEATSKEGIFW